jgi:hypothetical protein
MVFSNCHPKNSEQGKPDSAKTTLKQNSPLDNQKIQHSKEMMMEIYKQLNFIPDMETFINITNHCKDNHLFVNADNQGYIIVAVTNNGINQLPENERTRLTDPSDGNNAYKLRFLINHIIPTPHKTYPGIIYQTLAGVDVNISENRFDLKINDHTYRIISSIKISDELEIIALDSAMYF